MKRLGKWPSQLLDNSFYFFSLFELNKAPSVDFKISTELFLTTIIEWENFTNFWYTSMNELNSLINIYEILFLGIYYCKNKFLKDFFWQKFLRAIIWGVKHLKKSVRDFFDFWFFLDFFDFCLFFNKVYVIFFSALPLAVIFPILW